MAIADKIADGCRTDSRRAIHRAVQTERARVRLGRVATFPLLHARAMAGYGRGRSQRRPLRQICRPIEASVLRVLYLNYSYERTLLEPEDLLSRYVTVSGTAEALAALGVEITVLQRFGRDAR